MTVATILSRIKLQLNDPANFDWSESMLTSLVNEGYREFITQSHCLRKQDHVDITINTKTFTMPTDTLMIYRAEWDEHEIPVYMTPVADQQLPSNWRYIVGTDVQAILADHEGYGTFRIYPYIDTQSDIGHIVAGTDANVYRCILDHTATTDDTPITGANYATYWELQDSGTGATWAAGTEYKKYKYLYIDYAYMPVADLTSSDTPLIPTRYHPALIEYGLTFAQQQEKQSKRDVPMSNVHYQNYLRYVRYAKRDSQRGFIFNRRPMVSRRSFV